MNINAIEMMSLDKRNMNFGMKAKETPTAEPQGTVTKPQFAMNALEAQANNNISFQGSALAKIRHSKAMKAMMALMLIGGASTALTSCERDMEPRIYQGPVTVNVDVTVDMSEMTAIMTQYLTYMQQMMELMREQNETMNKFYKAFLEHTQAWQNKQESDEEYQKNILALFEQALTEVNALVGISAEQKAQIQAIYDLLNAGKISAAEAFQQIMNILNSIDSKLGDLLTEVKGLRAEQKEYADASLKYLKGIYKNGKITNENLKLLNETNIKNNECLNNMETKTDSIITILSNMSGNQLSPMELQAMLDALGIKIENVATMSKDDIIAAIEKFENTFIKVEKAQNKIYQAIYDKIVDKDTMKGILEDIIAMGQGGMTIDQLKEYMEERDARRDENNWAIFEKYMEENGFTNIPGQMTTANDLLTHIDGDLHDMGEYVKLLAPILEQLQNLNLNVDETNAILRDIYDLIDAFRNDCKDCCDRIIEHLKELVGTHEGVLD